MRIAVIILITAAIFVYDLVTPHGMSVSLLYLLPFSLLGLFIGKKFSFAIAGVTTALIIAGYFMGTAAKYPVISEINRTLTIIVGWGILAALIQRRRIIRKLAETNSALKAVFDCAPAAIISLDRDGNVMDWNKGAEEIFGYSHKEVKGKFYPLLNGSDETFRKNMSTLLEGNRILNMELSRKRKDGEVIEILASGAPLRDEEGSIIGGLVTLIDLTEKKKAEAEISVLNVEIARRNLLEREREDLAAMITHDLKSPLSAITGYTDLLLTREAELKEQEKQEMLEAIRHSGEKMLEMVEDYLTVYSSHAEKLELKAAPEEITDILRELEKDCHPVAEKKGVGLRFASAGSPRSVVDRKQLGRAVSNLIQNAIKFTPAGGRVLVSLDDTEQDFTISVHDTGPGIPEDEQGSVFEKHYRTSMAAGTKGAGLGLAIVKAVAEAHGGKVTLESRPGIGSTFKLTIPLKKEQNAA